MIWNMSNVFPISWYNHLKIFNQSYDESHEFISEEEQEAFIYI